MTVEPPIGQWVFPEDPMGDKDRHRKCGILLRCKGVLRKLCWVKAGSDGSFYFEFSNPNAALESISETRRDGDTFIVESEASLSEIPLGSRQNTHVSLHPGEGEVHVGGVENKGLLSVHKLKGWFPVKESFDWLLVVSDPVSQLLQIGNKGKRDGVFDFPDPEKSVYMRVRILSHAEDTTPRSPFLDIIMMGPHYGIQIDLRPSSPSRCKLFIKHD